MARKTKSNMKVRSPVWRRRDRKLGRKFQALSGPEMRILFRYLCHLFSSQEANPKWVRSDRILSAAYSCLPGFSEVIGKAERKVSDELLAVAVAKVLRDIYAEVCRRDLKKNETLQLILKARVQPPGSPRGIPLSSLFAQHQLEMLASRASKLEIRVPGGPYAFAKKKTGILFGVYSKRTMDGYLNRSKSGADYAQELLVLDLRLVISHFLRVIVGLPKVSAQRYADLFADFHREKLARTPKTLAEMFKSS